MTAPFRQFVLKIHSRCNLGCDYCYVYEMADQGWRQQPHLMSDATVAAALDRIAEHARAHELRAVRLILHGGEPLLAGPAYIERLAIRARQALVPVSVRLAVQTNGTLLDEPMLAVLSRHSIRVGVSLDGDKAMTDSHRRYRGGAGSYDAIARGLRRLGTYHSEIYGGLLCVISLDSDPVRTYESLLEHRPPMIDFLLPHGTWSSPPPSRPSDDDSSPYAEWLLRIFTRWASESNRPSIRMFDSIVSLILGGPTGTELLGLAPADTLVIQTDGTIAQVDSLSAAYDGAMATGLHVERDALDNAFSHPVTVERQGGLSTLSPVCQACEIVTVCGGGFYPHRYRAGAGFRNPSVYCPDLLMLITSIRSYVTAELARLDRHRFDV
jgi:uncharacterized protein